MGIPAKVGSWFVGIMALMAGTWAIKEYVVGEEKAPVATTSIAK